MDRITLADVRLALSTGNIYGLFDRFQAAFNSASTRSYDRGHSAGCQDGWSAAEDCGAQIPATDKRLTNMDCVLCGRHWPGGSNDGDNPAYDEWIPAYWDNATDTEIPGPVCPACMGHPLRYNVSGYGYYMPATYPADPLAPPTPYRMAYVPHSTRPRASNCCLPGPGCGLYARTGNSACVDCHHRRS